MLAVHKRIWGNVASRKLRAPSNDKRAKDQAHVFSPKLAAVFRMPPQAWPAPGALRGVPNWSSDCLQSRKAGMLLLQGPVPSVSTRPECLAGIAQGTSCSKRVVGGAGSSRALCKAAARETPAASKPSNGSQRTKLLNTLDILSDDLKYLHEHTGLDLTSPLSSVKEVHEQVSSRMSS